MKSELEKIQRRQREFARQKEKGFRTTERADAGSRPEPRMEVDEVPRSSGRFNLERPAREHINEGLEVSIPPESVSSVRGLEVPPIGPMMDVALPGYTPSSTPSSSQVSGSSSPLKELHDSLQLGTRDDSTRREQPVRSVVIASYKKIQTKDTTDTTGWIGPRNREREGVVSTTRHGPITTHSREYRRVRSI